MKKIIFSLVCIALALVSCGDSAKDVNTVIISQLKEIENKLEFISHHISEDRYEDAKVVIDSLPVQITVAKATISALSNSRAGAYKTSALDYLSYIEKEAGAAFTKSMDLFQAAKIREQDDVAKGKQSPYLVNSGPDFDAARKIVKDFMKELKKYHEVVIEKNEKFLKANNLKG
jgi:hypothetical protein